MPSIERTRARILPDEIDPAVRTAHLSPAYGSPVVATRRDLEDLCGRTLCTITPLRQPDGHASVTVHHETEIVRLGSHISLSYDVATTAPAGRALVAALLLAQLTREMEASGYHDYAVPGHTLLLNADSPETATGGTVTTEFVKAGPS